MLIDLVTSLLAFILIVLVAGNNLSVCVGPIVGGRILKRRTGVLLVMAGYIAGFLAGGTILRNSILQLLPSNQTLIMPIVLVISIGIFAVAYRKKVPQSLSITFICAILGAGLAYGGSINLSFAVIIILAWVFAAVATLVLSYFVMGMTSGAFQKSRIWRTLSYMKLILVILSFFTAFTLGANTLGTIYSSLQSNVYSALLIIIAIALGCLFFSSGVLRRIGNDIIPLRYTNALVSQLISASAVQVATFFGVPLSNAQMLTSSIYGVGLSYKTKIIRRGPAVEILSTWIITAVLSFAIAYAATYLIVFH